MTDAVTVHKPGPGRCPTCGSDNIRWDTFAHAMTHSGQPRPIDYYDRVKQWDFTCLVCGFSETGFDNEAKLDDIMARWRNPACPPYTAAEIKRDTDYIIAKGEENDRKRTWPRDPVSGVEYYQAKRTKRLADEYSRALPENLGLLADILARPEDDGLRRAYAAWMKMQPPALRRSQYPNAPIRESSSNPADAAWFINAQLDVYDALRANPKADIAPFMHDRVDGYQGSLDRLRGGIVLGYGEYDIFSVTGFTDNHFFVRGFIEHLAVKAKAFLTFAEFLYTLVPLRHLTLTYCPAVLDGLAASPHLARIRSLDLPNRMLNNEYTRLNDLTDAHVQTLAGSPHLAGLRYLDLEDNEALTVRALDHLALSPHLRSLSHVRLDLYSYHRTHGAFGAHTRTLGLRRLDEWRAPLEARHGYLPWLHPEEHYGSPTPDLEAVDAHPVGDPAVRPDLDARRRARLPAAAELALSACLHPDGTLRARSLEVDVPGGHLAATLDRAAPDPDLSDLRALVTLTIRRATAPLRAWDATTRANLDLAPGATVTLGVRLPHAPAASS